MPEDTRPMRALSIRQPHAEAIMRGVKKIEYRSGPTRIRGRVYVYTSLRRSSVEDESEMMDYYGINVAPGPSPEYDRLEDSKPWSRKPSIWERSVEGVRHVDLPQQGDC